MHKHEVATQALGQDVREWVREKRQERPRWSLELLAEELSEVAGVTISRETVRKWAHQ